MRNGVSATVRSKSELDKSERGKTSKVAERRKGGVTTGGSKEGKREWKDRFCEAVRGLGAD